MHDGKLLYGLPSFLAEEFHFGFGFRVLGV